MEPGYRAADQRGFLRGWGGVIAAIGGLVVGLLAAPAIDALVNALVPAAASSSKPVALLLYVLRLSALSGALLLFLRLRRSAPLDGLRRGIGDRRTLIETGASFGVAMCLWTLSESLRDVLGDAYARANAVFWWWLLGVVVLVGIAEYRQRLT